MNMQTGPAPGQSIERWLLLTGLLEIANVGIFAMLWLTLNRIIPGESDVLSLAGLLTTDLLLFVGGLYWLLKRARFFERMAPRPRLRLLQAVYALTGLSLLVYPALLAIRLLAGLPVERGDALLGAGLWLFGVGEFVHYFIVKINMRPDERRRGRPVPARLRRELERAIRQVRQVG